MSEANYIAVDSKPASIIKRCRDRSCDRYHEWVRFDMRAGYYDARLIADALNEKEARR